MMYAARQVVSYAAIELLYLILSNLVKIESVIKWLIISIDGISKSNQPKNISEQQVYRVLQKSNDTRKANQCCLH